MTEKKIESILDECIERLAKGERLEQCLASYPEQAAELEPLLRIVATVKMAAAVEPGDEFKARTKYAAMSALRGTVEKKKRVWYFGNLGMRRAFAAVAVGITALVITGGSVVAASTDSLPGQTLYAVKTAVENVQLAFTPSDVGKAKLLASFADRRVSEIERLVLSDEGGSHNVDIASTALLRNLNQVAEVLEPSSMTGSGDGMLSSEVKVEQTETKTQTAFDATTNTITATAAPPPKVETTEEIEPGEDQAIDIREASNISELREALNAQAIQHQTKLEELQGKASVDDVPALLRALDRAVRGYQAIEGY